MAGARHGNLRLRAFRRGLVRGIAGSVQPLLRHVEAVQTFLLARQLVVRHGDGGAGVRIALRRHETVRRAIADAEREGGFVLVLDLLHLVAVALPDGLILLVEARHSVLRESAEHDLACVQAADAHDPRDSLEAVIRDPRAVLLLFAGQAEGQRILHVFRLRAFTPALLGFDGQLRDLVVPQRRRAACVLRVRLRIGRIPVREVLARVLRETAVCHLAVEAARHVQFPEAVGVGAGVLDNAVFHGDRVGFQPLELGAPFVRFCQRDRVAAFRAALRPRAVDVIPARLVERDLYAAEFLGNRVLCAIRRVPFLGQVDADFAVLVLRAVDVGQRRRDRAGGFAGVRVDGVGDAGCGVARHFALDDVVNVVELVAVRVRAGGFQLRPLGVPVVRCRQRSLATAVIIVRMLADERPLLRAEHTRIRCRLLSQHLIVLFLRQHIAAKHHEDAGRARILMAVVANPVLLHLHVVAVLAVLHLNVDVRRAVDGVRTIHHALDAGSSHERLQRSLRDCAEVAIVVAFRVSRRMFFGIVRSRNDVEDDQRAILQHEVVRLDCLRFRQHVRDVRVEGTLVQLLRIVLVSNHTVLIRVDLTIFAANRLELFGFRVPCVERELRSRQQQRGVRTVHLADDQIVVDVAAALTEVVVIAVVQFGT